MAGESPTSLRWLTLAVLLPLLVLGALAWLGTRTQVRAAWSSAREEAKAAGEIAAQTLERELAAAVESVPVFPDPPVPGTRTAADDVLDRGDLAALRGLRDDADAGISPAGLPRRVLAAFRVYEMTRDTAEGAALLEISTRDAPSVLTPMAIGKLGDLAGDRPQRWARGERAREVFRMEKGPSRPFAEDRSSGVLETHSVEERGWKRPSPWISASDGTWWMELGRENLRVIPPEALSTALTAAVKFLPAWAELRFPPAGLPAAGEPLAAVPVDFPGGGTLEIIAARPALVEAAARQQARWTLGLLLVAFATSASALVFIHRAVLRERRLNALKSDFVASVSHELRAPVASIRLMADALVAGKIGGHTAGEFHGLISREGARLSTLIENVLDFARIEQGRKQWHFEPADLTSLLAGTLEIMKPLAAEKSIALVCAELPEVEANVDPGAIQQALVNLLDNAIKFSPADSTVEISLAAISPNWEIRIADQGPGIPAAEHQRIFRKFHRLGGELRRETQGTGIGLSLVKAVAEAHGGRVLLESAPGQGSAFTLTCPIGLTPP